MARGLLAQLNWRLLASLAMLGNLIAVASLWFIERPGLGQLSWSLVGKAVFVGLLGQLGVFMFFKAMDAGGKAAIVVPLTALYPAFTLVGALLFLGESVTFGEFAGIFLAILAGVLLARG